MDGKTHILLISLSFNILIKIAVFLLCIAVYVNSYNLTTALWDFWGGFVCSSVYML